MCMGRRWSCEGVVSMVIRFCLIYFVLGFGIDPKGHALDLESTHNNSSMRKQLQ